MYPRRPKDNLVVYCLACPEAEVNMEPNWEKTPSELRYAQANLPFEVKLIHPRHTITIFDTVDGNSKTGNYAKNNDPKDVSLFAGRAYMPGQKRHEHYMKTVPQIQKEVSPPSI